MLEILTVINLVVASFMIGNDYEQIVEYQNQINMEDQPVITAEANIQE